MSLDLDAAEQEPITSVDDLVGYFRSAERRADEHRLGLEHEKLLYPLGGSRPVPYEGERGIGELLRRLEPRGFAPFRESGSGPTIALMRGAQTLSLEPGGQLELSGAPYRTAREAHAENLAHLAELKEACAGLGLQAVALGYRPFATVEAMPWMPKARYQAMRESLPERGAHALEMMLMTATGQASFDWSDEADCVRKVVVASRLAPVLVALYANSPLRNGRPAGLLSFRSHVWTAVDPTRCGFLPATFDNSFSYRAYVDWALDAPLLFLRRGGLYHRPRLNFRQLLADGFEGQPATRADWTDHLSTLFPEVRIKRVVEIRSADCVNAELTAALAALWRGLLYDPQSLGDAARLLPPLSLGEHLELMELARREGLSGRTGQVDLGSAAKEMVALAREGLSRIDPKDASLLDPLAELAESGVTMAERVLEAFGQDPDPAALLTRFAV